MLAAALNVTMQKLLVHGLFWVFVESRHGKVAALFSTTVLFVLMHAGAFEAGIVAVLSVTAAGLLFGLITGWLGGLPAAIAAHAVWNIVGGLVLGAVVLGDDVSWFLTSSREPLWAGSAASGIEGGLIVLLVTVGLVAALALAIRRHEISGA